MVIEIDVLQRIQVNKFSCICSSCSSDNVEIAVDTKFKDKSYTGHSNGSPVLVIKCNNCKIQEDVRLSY